MLEQQKQHPARVVTAVVTERSVLAARAAGVRLYEATVAAGRVIEFPEQVQFRATGEGYQVMVGETYVGMLIRQQASHLVPWLLVAPDVALSAAS